MTTLEELAAMQRKEVQAQDKRHREAFEALQEELAKDKQIKAEAEAAEDVESAEYFLKEAENDLHAAQEKYQEVIRDGKAN